MADALLVTDDAVRAAQRALWDELRVIAEPSGATSLAALMAGAYKPAAGEKVGVLICGAKFLEQRERAGRLVGGADIEQAREMGEVIRHGDLLNGEDPAKNGRELCRDEGVVGSDQLAGSSPAACRAACAQSICR